MIKNRKRIIALVATIIIVFNSTSTMAKENNSMNNDYTIEQHKDFFLQQLRELEDKKDKSLNDFSLQSKSRGQAAGNKFDITAYERDCETAAKTGDLSILDKYDKYRKTIAAEHFDKDGNTKSIAYFDIDGNVTRIQDFDDDRNVKSEYMNALSSSISWHNYKPSNPDDGDGYYTYNILYDRNHYYKKYDESTGENSTALYNLSRKVFDIGVATFAKFKVTGVLYAMLGWVIPTQDHQYYTEVIVDSIHDYAIEERDFYVYNDGLIFDGWDNKLFTNKRTTEGQVDAAYWKGTNFYPLDKVYLGKIKTEEAEYWNLSDAKDRCETLVDMGIDGNNHTSYYWWLGSTTTYESERNIKNQFDYPNLLDEVE